MKKIDAPTFLATSTNKRKKTQRITRTNAISSQKLKARDIITRRTYQIDHSGVATLICANDTIRCANVVCGELLGEADPSRLCGKPIYEFIDPISHNYFREISAALPASMFSEQIWQRSNGSRFDAEIFLAPLGPDEKNGVQIIIRDITKIKQEHLRQLGQNRILNMLANGSDTHLILQEIVSFVEENAEDALCYIRTYNPAEQRFTRTIARALPDEFSNKAGLNDNDDSDCICVRAARLAEPVITTDLNATPLFSGRALFIREYGIVGCTAWPAFGQDHSVVGTVSLYYKKHASSRSGECDLLAIATRLAGLAINRQITEDRIRTLAHYDGLTGLPNRFLFQEYLELALRNAHRRLKQFAVLFIDLDRFKEINDTYGHDAGDHALRIVSSRLRACIRDSDKIARMGGDEFYVLIEDLEDGSYAANVGQKLIDAAARPVQIGSSLCHLGASIGVALFPRDGTDARTLLSKADTAMYEAKEAGRNACFFHSADAAH